MSPDCPDSFQGRRFGYFGSGSDARRCPAGGVVAKVANQNKRRFCLVVSAGVIFVSIQRTEHNHDTINDFAGLCFPPGNSSTNGVVSFFEADRVSGPRLVFRAGITGRGSGGQTPL